MPKETGSLGQIRGAAFDDFLEWYGRERNGAQLKSVVEALPAEVLKNVHWREGLPRLVPFAWYPCELVHGVLDGLLVGLSEWERQSLSRQAADHVMEQTLHGIYRAVFKAIASPNMMARFSSRLWGLYYDTGKTEAVMETSTQHRNVYSAWKGHHPFLCDVNRYSNEWLYRSLGCQNVRSKRIECVGEGKAQCTFVTTWT
jgi:hypothetical protein